jgi:CO dehydrogenase nickel-insertion accessory protein CooC1
MTTAVAVAGKSGTGKTAFTRAIFTALHNKYPEKSVLLVDNSLGMELASAFGLDVINTIHSIRTGKYIYKCGDVEDLKKSEYVECALHEIIINLDSDVDLMVSGPVFTEECTCITARYIKEAMKKLIKSYDIVIFDCEYDLSYVNQLVDYYPDVTLVLAEPTVVSVNSAVKIRQSSLKYALPGQIGVVLNKVRNSRIPDKVKEVMNESELDILGVLPYDEQSETYNIAQESEALVKSTQELLFRLNVPLWGG